MRKRFCLLLMATLVVSTGAFAQECLECHKKALPIS